ncbi:MAG: hypothetical protein MNPFHGCM_00310 [Gemmatimonadaceae bacterium]|nr:hypothetical protein [Gemmatimonadaceae bacterium]
MRTRWALLALGVTGGVPGAVPGGALPQLVVVGPTGDTLRTVTPQFTVRASNVDDGDRPLMLTLQVDDRATFDAPPLFESTGVGDSMKVAIERPLPAATQVYWRAVVRTARGQEAASDVTGPRVTSPWARLVEPNSSRGVTLDSRRPRFTWSPARLPPGSGPWRFRLDVENVATRQILSIGPMLDTSAVPTVDLETNSSYRWAVTSFFPAGDSAMTRSDASFVIVDAASPTVTLLYQNFPNPFPTAGSATTCIWFDLHRSTTVQVTVHDIRGGLVRTIIPNEAVRNDFSPGRYGRGTVGSNTGCDMRFVWDGRGDDGQPAPTGVYLIRLKTDYSVSFKRALYRGR